MVVYVWVTSRAGFCVLGKIRLDCPPQGRDIPSTKALGTNSLNQFQEKCSFTEDWLGKFLE